MTKRLPKTLFVKTENDGDIEYFVTNDSPDALVDMGQKVKIGTYQLVEINNYEGVATKLKG
jgi:hypothetical protein